MENKQTNNNLLVLNIDNTKVEILIKRYSTSKSLRLYMSDGQIRVTAPPKVSLQVIRNFLKPWHGKIIAYYNEALANQNKYDEERDNLDFDIFYFGRKLTLKIELINSTDYYKPYTVTDNELILKVYNKTNTDYIIKMIHQFYQAEATKHLVDFTQKVAKDIFIDLVPKVVIKNMIRQWGNCRYKVGKVTLNTKLIRLPKYLHTYIIIHELAHFIHHNHSADFHLLVDKWLAGKEKEFDSDIRKWSFILRDKIL